MSQAKLGSTEVEGEKSKFSKIGGPPAFIAEQQIQDRGKAAHQVALQEDPIITITQIAEGQPSIQDSDHCSQSQTVLEKAQDEHRQLIKNQSAANSKNSSVNLTVLEHEPHRQTRSLVGYSGSFSQANYSQRKDKEGHCNDHITDAPDLKRFGTGNTQSHRSEIFDASAAISSASATQAHGNFGKSQHELEETITTRTNCNVKSPEKINIANKKVLLSAGDAEDALPTQTCVSQPSNTKIHDSAQLQTSYINSSSREVREISQDTLVEAGQLGAYRTENSLKFKFAAPKDLIDSAASAGIHAQFEEQSRVSQSTPHTTQRQTVTPQITVAAPADTTSLGANLTERVQYGEVNLLHQSTRDLLARDRPAPTGLVALDQRQGNSINRQASAMALGINGRNCYETSLGNQSDNLLRSAEFGGETSLMGTLSKPCAQDPPNCVPKKSIIPLNETFRPETGSRYPNTGPESPDQQNQRQIDVPIDQTQLNIFCSSGGQNGDNFQNQDLQTRSSPEFHSKKLYAQDHFFQLQQLPQDYFRPHGNQDEPSQEIDDAVTLIQQMRQRQEQQGANNLDDGPLVDSEEAAATNAEIQNLMEQHFGEFKPEFLFDNVLTELPKTSGSRQSNPATALTSANAAHGQLIKISDDNDHQRAFIAKVNQSEDASTPKNVLMDSSIKPQVDDSLQPYGDMIVFGDGKPDESNSIFVSAVAPSPEKRRDMIQFKELSPIKRGGAKSAQKHSQPSGTEADRPTLPSQSFESLSKVKFSMPDRDAPLTSTVQEQWLPRLETERLCEILESEVLDNVGVNLMFKEGTSLAQGLIDGEKLARVVAKVKSIAVRQDLSTKKGINFLQLCSQMSEPKETAVEKKPEKAVKPQKKVPRACCKDLSSEPCTSKAHEISSQEHSIETSKQDDDPNRGTLLWDNCINFFRNNPKLLLQMIPSDDFCDQDDAKTQSVKSRPLKTENLPVALGPQPPDKQQGSPSQSAILNRFQRIKEGRKSQFDNLLARAQLEYIDNERRAAYCPSPEQQKQHDLKSLPGKKHPLSQPMQRQTFKYGRGGLMPQRSDAKNHEYANITHMMSKYSALEHPQQHASKMTDGRAGDSKSEGPQKVNQQQGVFGSFINHYGAGVQVKPLTPACASAVASSRLASSDQLRVTMRARQIQGQFQYRKSGQSLTKLRTAPAKCAAEQLQVKTAVSLPIVIVQQPEQNYIASTGAQRLSTASGLAKTKRLNNFMLKSNSQKQPQRPSTDLANALVSDSSGLNSELLTVRRAIAAQSQLKVPQAILIDKNLISQQRPATVGQPSLHSVAVGQRQQKSGSALPQQSVIMPLDWSQTPLFHSFQNGNLQFNVTRDQRLLSQDEVGHVIEMIKTSCAEFQSADMMRPFHMRGRLTLSEQLNEISQPSLRAHYMQRYNKVTIENTLKILVRCKILFSCRSKLNKLFSEIVSYEGQAQDMRCILAQVRSYKVAERVKEMIQKQAQSLFACSERVRYQIKEFQISQNKRKAQPPALSDTFIFKNKDFVPYMKLECSEVAQLLGLIDVNRTAATPDSALHEVLNQSGGNHSAVRPQHAFHSHCNEDQILTDSKDFTRSI